MILYINKKRSSRFYSLSLVVLLFTTPISTLAQDWQTVIQPLGTIKIVETASTVNTRLVNSGGATPTTLPFDSGASVTTIKTSAPQYFFRSYNVAGPANLNNTDPTISYAVGSWMAPRWALRGKSAAQIRDVLALPAQPTMMTMVLVPAGATMYTGVAGPIHGWGNGGAQQSKIIGPYVPGQYYTGASYLNQQIYINPDCVLCYNSFAVNYNNKQVAAYLDNIPTPLASDLESISGDLIVTPNNAVSTDLMSVYDSLDLLYFTPNKAQFNDALTQISPLRYDDLTENALRTNMLYNDMIDERITTMLLSEELSVAAPGPDKNNQKGVWAKIASTSEFASKYGFDTKTNGFFPGIDKRITDNILLGFAAGITHSKLDWANSLGNTTSNLAMGGLYAAWLPGRWFVQGGLNAGFAFRDTLRNLNFSTISRSANSAPNGAQGNARVRAGYRLSVAKIDFAPIASLDYFCQRRNALSETGANSLNLQVDSAINHSLRSHLGVAAVLDYNLSHDLVLSPQVQAGWAHIMSLDKHGITASFGGRSDNFTVYGNSSNVDALTTSAGLYLTAHHKFYIFARYNGEYRHGLINNLVSGGINYSF